MLRSCSDQTQACPSRLGFSLAELVFALALGALVLGLVSSVGIRLQRKLLSEGARLASGEQLSASAELFPLDLRGLSPPYGDIAEARDTVVQIRAPIWSGVVCAAAGNAMTVAGYLGASAHQITPPAQSGDTLWLLAPADSGDSWRPLRIDSIRRTGGPCPAIDASGAPVFDLSQLWSVVLRDSLVATRGSIVRLTRPLRLSIYRSSDGRWYLGMRTWNTASAQWNVVQPLAGPFAPPSRGGAHFQYFDALSRPLPLGAPDLGSIARVEALFVADSVAAAAISPVDSQRIVVAMRNR